MSEEVQTGGLKRFVYPKGHQPKRDSELSEEIATAYRNVEIAKAKRRAKINKIIIILAVILIVGIIIYFA